MMAESAFDPLRLGPLTLRNRFIRSAAFEGMSAHHDVTPALIDYHASVASGGAAMTTVAYAAVSKSGLSFPHQLWLRPEILPGLRKLTDTVHARGAKVSIQIGHTGNMANRKVTGSRPIAPSGRLNFYGPTWPREMNTADIAQVVNDFSKAVTIAMQSGFDAVEIHAGHGYLISQFLSPATNFRRDAYGGSFENRSRFLKEVLIACREAAGPEMALLVKMNMSDGFPGGITSDDAIASARLIETLGADAIVLSGGFVSRTPLFIMRGEINPRMMAYHMKGWLERFVVEKFGYTLMKPMKFEEGYFLPLAQPFRKAVSIPLVVVGGMNSHSIIQQALDMGFDGIGIARALIHQPDFIHQLQEGLINKSGCTVCNYCVAVMYSGEMRCYLRDKDAPPELMAIADNIRYAH